MKRYTCIGLLCVAIAGCTSSGHLTRRFKSVSYKSTEKIGTMISATAFINDKEKEEPPKPRVILDALSPQGQKAYLKSISGKEVATDKFIAAVTSSFSSKENNVEVLDYTKIEKRINLSIENMGHEFGNRVVKLRATLKFDPKVIQLKSCDRLTTQYQTIDLGKLNYANSSGFEGNASAGVGYTGVVGNTGTNSNKNTGENKVTSDNSSATNGSESNWSNGTSNSLTSTGNVAASAKYTGSKSFAEEVMLRQRIVALTASIDENTLALYQESISGIDLTGTTTADIVLNSDDIAVKRVFSFIELFGKDGVMGTPDKVKVKESRILYHNLTQDITAEFAYSADYRSINKGAKTISESDDKIILYYGKVLPKTITLLKKEQIRPKMWILTTSSGTQLPATIQGAFGSGELIFIAYSDALSFLSWLRKQALLNNGIKIGDYIVNMPSGFTNLNALTILPN
jgi:hypothetical protein